jgi:hypothetical protein
MGRVQPAICVNVRSISREENEDVTFRIGLENAIDQEIANYFV